MYNIVGLIFSKQDGSKQEKVDIVGKDFLIKSQDPAITEEMDKQQSRIEELSNVQEMPKWLTAVKGAMLLLSIAFILFYMVFDQYSWSMVFIILGLIMVVGIAVLNFTGNRRKQKITAKNEAEVRAMLPKISATYKKAKRAMAIPDSAKEMDVITQRYAYGKNGELVEKSLIVADCANIAQYVYVSNGNLIIAGLDKIFAIPLSSITALRRVDKKCSVRGWNKKVSPRDERFKQLGLKVGRYDVYTVKWYYELVVEDGARSGVVRLMPYELSAIKKLTGLEESVENA